MNSPDIPNQRHAVLLRLRCGEHAALGDIKKSYNSVCLEDREVHLHRFLWRDSEDEELAQCAITRVKTGDKRCVRLTPQLRAPGAPGRQLR